MSVKKTLRFETPLRRLELDVRLERQEPHDGELDTNLEPVTEAHNRLAISAGFWERNSPRARWREDQFGQCRDTVEAFATDLPEAQRAPLLRLCELWREWHMNDMQAGTEAQRAALADMPRERTVDWYSRACDFLATRGLLTDRGYKFGSKWLVRRLPTAVATEVLAIAEQLGA